MTLVEKMGQLMGEALVRGADCELERRLQMLVAYMDLIDLELEAALTCRGGRRPAD